MTDWFTELAPMPDPVAHAAFRAGMQDILTVRCQAQGALAAAQARAMRHPDKPVLAKDAIAMKRLERALEDARRQARVAAEAYYPDLAAADAIQWHRLIETAEIAVAGAVSKIQLHFAAYGTGGDEASGHALGHAIIMLAWALCDAPIALRIMRSGETARAAAAR